MGNDELEHLLATAENKLDLLSFMWKGESASVRSQIAFAYLRELEGLLENPGPDYPRFQEAQKKAAQVALFVAEESYKNTSRLDSEGFVEVTPVTVAYYQKAVAHATKDPDALDTILEKIHKAHSPQITQVALTTLEAEYDQQKMAAFMRVPLDFLKKAVVNFTAQSAFQKGDYEGAAEAFLDADMPVEAVRFVRNLGIVFHANGRKVSLGGLIEPYLLAGWQRLKNLPETCYFLDMLGKHDEAKELAKKVILSVEYDFQTRVSLAWQYKLFDVPKLREEMEQRIPGIIDEMEDEIGGLKPKQHSDTKEAAMLTAMYSNYKPFLTPSAVAIYLMPLATRAVDLHLKNREYKAAYQLAKECNHPQLPGLQTMFKFLDGAQQETSRF